MMNTLATKKLQNKPNYWRKLHSLSAGLVFWFLLLSLVPLSIVSWISYQQAYASLTQDNIDKLEQSALLNQRFILDWFEHRFMDISIQAENHGNTQFLSILDKKWNSSHKDLSDFVKSYDWTISVSEMESELISLRQHYNYIYDLFLIDNKGNILYTVARESDLGTNLFDDNKKATNFSRIVKKTLDSGKTLVSDLERYAPSGDIVSGFLTAPILDEFGEKQGVFAIQIHLDQVFRTLSLSNTSSQSMKYFLVGEDGKLRTSIFSQEEVLNKKINSEQFLRWKSSLLSNKETKTTFTYINSDEKEVIGIRSDIILPGINWVLIGEIDLVDALVDANWLRTTTLFLVLITAFIVIFLAFFIAGRISKPIIMLASISKKVADGELNHQVTVNAKNEIGQLANSFNLMLQSRLSFENMLHEKNEQTQNVLAELADQKFAMDQHAIVAVTDVKGIITFANAKFCEITGYEEKELIGENHRLLNSGLHDVQYFKNMYRCIASGCVWQGEICNKSKSGEIYWVDTTIVPFLNENQKPASYIAIRTDITSHKLSEIALREAVDAAETATQLKSDFLANMSHEIRTPMNGVIGMTGLLLDTNLTARQKDYATNTMKSADALLTIINDILDFSKIEAGKMELEQLPFDLQHLAEDVTELMALKCREKNVEMLFRYKPGTKRLLIGDPGRIRQILLNLLSNAVKFTDKGSILLTIESHGTVDNVITILAKIEDTGIGIDENKIEKIFNKFDQEDGSTTRKYGGTGLGLAICQQLCNLMQGDILVKSKKGEGSTFIFTMNLTVNEDDLVDISLTENTFKLKGLKLLIIDDLEIARTILVEQLSGLDINIESTCSGEKALAILTKARNENSPFNIVIIDYYMPEMDGVSLAKEIRLNNLTDNGVLVFITSAPRRNDAKRLQELGFDGYLTKPTHPSEVSKLLALIWDAKTKNKEIPLITRHHLLKNETKDTRKLHLVNVNILLVEDNPINQLVATEYLESYGCTVTPAGNGLEAVSLVNEMDFDLIFMDCQMPEMDGYEATAEIRDIESSSDVKRTPIVAFTANAMQGDKEKCLEAGMDDFISKPVIQNSIANILQKWLPDKVSLKENACEEDTNIVDDSLPDSDCFDTVVFDQLQDLFQEKFPDAVEAHISNLEENITKIKTAMAENDLETLERIAHSIKGASAQFGAKEVSVFSKQMEQMAKNDELNNSPKCYEDIVSSFETIKKLMRERL